MLLNRLFVREACLPRFTGPQPALLYLAPSTVLSVVLASWRYAFAIHDKDVAHRCSLCALFRLGGASRVRDDFTKSWCVPAANDDDHIETGGE